MKKKAMIFTGKALSRALALIHEYEGVVLANYGQSILVRIDTEGLQALETEGYRIRELAEQPVIQMGGFALNTAHPESRSTVARAATMALPTGRSHHILHLAGPMHPDWKIQLEQMGVIFTQSVAEDHFLISVDSSKVDDLQALDFVEAVSPYFPALKINPTLLTPELQNRLPTMDALAPVAVEVSEEAEAIEAPTRALRSRGLQTARPMEPEKVGNLELVLFDADDQLAVIDAVRGLGAQVIKAAANEIIVFADMQLVPQLAAIPQVLEVNPYHPPVLTNNVATGIIHSDTLHSSYGLDGSGQVVAIADTGLDTGVNDASMLADFQGRIVSIHALGRPGDASDIHNHGTHVAGSVLGDGANSNGQIQGMAPAARVVFQSTMDAGRGLGGLPADLRLGLFDVARDEGARIHTNSWSNSPTNGAYLNESRQADDFAFNNREFLILFSAGNDAPYRVNAPGSAKNVLTVGASESVRPLPASVNFPGSPTFPGGAAWPHFDQQADDQNDVASFSCPGPAQNNRRKPDVVAPGTFILSTRSSVSTDDTGADGLSGTGDEDGVFTHGEAVGIGLPGEPVFGSGDEDTPDPPPGSGAAAVQNYMYLGGTSMSTPITAGTCALVRQYLIEQRGHTPSAALLKALIINGASDMGMGIPHNGQGWGRIDLTNTLFPPGTHRVQFDDTLDNAVTTGDIRTYEVFVSSAAAPLIVTLVWRDPPGSTIQNRLHLRVSHVDSGTISTSDDIANILNNVQKVVVNPPQVGLYRIEVEGVNVTMGVPELPGVLRQDYALVVASATGFSGNPSDIVQVIDRSGSMGFSGYMEPAKERAKQMIDILQINDKAGVVTFEAAATEAFPLTLINSQDAKDDAHAQIDLITSSGMTDLREALEQGLTTLGADIGRPRAMVFLSDGIHTVAPPKIDDPFLNSIAAANIKVYTIALGPASDFNVLNNIASRTGTGSVYTVESAADLHKLHEIYYDILGGIGRGTVIHLNSAPVSLDRVLVQSAAIDVTGREAHFALSWEQAGAALEFTLIDPSGKTYDRNSPEVFYFQGSTHQFYRVANPEAGRWKLVVELKEEIGNQPLRVTTAALVDTEVKCEVHLDPKYLYEDKVLLYLKTYHGDRPLVGGKAIARISYPTLSIDTLLRKHVEELKEITLDQEKLAGDKGDETLIKLGMLAALYGARGEDIFERETVEIQLRDDGREEDPQPEDGIYTAFFDPKQAGVAGNFQIQVFFEVEDEKLGTYTYTKLVPVYVPRLTEVKAELIIKDIFVRHNRLWGYTIIGARVVHPDNTPALPSDGVAVNMVLTQGLQRVRSGDLPYYRDGHYYIWRFKERGFRLGKVGLQVMAKLNGMVVATVKQSIKL